MAAKRAARRKGASRSKTQTASSGQLELALSAQSAPKAGKSSPPAPDPSSKPAQPARKVRRAKGPRGIAEQMAAQQREISVSEFFAKNRHLLGFDNKNKALLTTIKEAVDNSLDACEEAEILPDLHIRVEQVDQERFRVTVLDNGPGIVKGQIPNIFGKLLYGSKFHRLKMSRGQQGIGISAAGMYGLLTTGKPIQITSRTSPAKDAHHYEVQIDTHKNRPDVIKDETAQFPLEHGTKVVIELIASYGRGRQSVDEYLRQTAIANPHAQIVYHAPGRETVRFERSSDVLPEPTRAIKPHPYGIELGALLKMIKDTKSRHLGGFLSSEFSRVSSVTAARIAERAGLTARTWIGAINGREAEAIYNAIQQTRLMAPPTNCLAPIGGRQILAGLLRGVKAEFFAAGVRPPAVYRGNPFQIEAGIAYGGDLPADQPARLIRFANRVPLLYQQSHCAVFKSAVDVNWRAYKLQQSRDALPAAPMVIMVHMASVWVPFTSESKEAIADYDEIRKEIKLALQDCGRKLAAYINRRRRVQYQGKRREVFDRYIGELVEAVATIKRINREQFGRDLRAIARTVTAQADAEFDQDGHAVVPAGSNGDEHTLVIDAETGQPETPPTLFEQRRPKK